MKSPLSITVFMRSLIIVGLFNLGSFAHAATSEGYLEARLRTCEYIPLEYDVMYLVQVRA